MRFTSIVLVAGVAACAHPSHGSLGIQGHLTEAQRCEKEAKVHEDEAGVAEVAARKHDFVCGDTVLADQATSGGKPLMVRTPCWSPSEEEAARQHDAADRLHAEAAQHRAEAAALRDAETSACATIPRNELDHSPFAHRSDIAAVTAELDDDHLVGARIRFLAVPGLTADWMRSALTCFHARAAAYGFDPTYLGYDPTLVDGATATVVDDPTGLTVIVRGSDAAAALAIYGRAEDLLGP